ncbi:MAG: hypothetical protein QG656_85, partial [Candidatus Hydrogenedentes bacterium]|nr:hypothetical protein [Candidatus Hydrogenedentota bacterium]
MKSAMSQLMGAAVFAALMLSPWMAALGQTPSTLNVSPVKFEKRAQTVTLIVSVLPVLDTGFTVDYHTSDGTALAGTDYTAAAGTLTFAAHQSFANLSLTILDSQALDGDKTLDVAFTPSTTDVDAATVTVTIQSPTSVFHDDFERLDTRKWDFSGPWSRDESNTCVTPGYNSSSHAMVYSGINCQYPNNSIGYLTMKTDVALPQAAESASLTWYDFVGAEPEYDFYSVRLSLDGGVNWPYELLSSSRNELFWDIESVDLTPFLGQSVRVQFVFEADRDLSNIGWFVDDVDISYRGLPPGVSALSVADPLPVHEGAGTTNISFTVNVAPPIGQDITVEYFTTNGTARSGVDFVGVDEVDAQSFTIPANTAVTQIDVPLMGNQLVEADKSFTITIQSNNPNVLVVRGVAQGTIANDDEGNCFFTDDFEGGNFDTIWSINGICRRQDNSQCIPGKPGYASDTHAVAFNDAEGTCSFYASTHTFGVLEMKADVAVPSSALNASLNFNSYYGATSSERADVFVSTDSGLSWTALARVQTGVSSWQPVSIALDDYIGQSVRFRFMFQAPNNVYHEGPGWYLDDIAVCSTQLPAGYSKITIEPVGQIEGDDGLSQFQFRVEVSPPYMQGSTLQALDIRYKTLALEGATAAVADEDFEYVSSGQVTVNAGDGEAYLLVNVIGDTELEYDETFKAVIDDVLTGLPSQPAQNVFVAVTEAVGTILNDDHPYALQVTPVSQQVGEADGKATVTIKLLKPGTTQLSPLTQSVTVNYSTLADTAKAGLNFTPVSGQHLFEMGSSAACALDIPIVINYAADVLKSFSFTASSEDGLTASVDIDIVDDGDAGAGTHVVSAQIGKVYVTEGSSPYSSAEAANDIVSTAQIHLSINPPATFDIQIAYTTQDGIAKAGVDYEAAYGTFTIPANNATWAVDGIVKPYGDHLPEDDNKTFITLLTPLTADVSAAYGPTVYIKDDDYRKGATVENNNLTYRWNSVYHDAYNVIIPDTVNPVNGGDFAGFHFDKFYAADKVDHSITAIPMATPNQKTIVLSPTAGLTPKDLTWDHTSGLMYVCTEETVATIPYDRLHAISGITGNPVLGPNLGTMAGE